MIPNSLRGLFPNRMSAWIDVDIGRIVEADDAREIVASWTERSLTGRSLGPELSDTLYAASRIDERTLVRLTMIGGNDAVARFIEENVARTARHVFQAAALRRLVLSSLDFALFAEEHAGEHGFDAERGVHELWKASGLGREAYEARRKRVMAWVRRGLGP